MKKATKKEEMVLGRRLQAINDGVCMLDYSILIGDEMLTKRYGLCAGMTTWQVDVGNKETTGVFVTSGSYS